MTKRTKREVIEKALTEMISLTILHKEYFSDQEMKDLEKVKDMLHRKISFRCDNCLKEAEVFKVRKNIHVCSTCLPADKEEELILVENIRKFRE